MKMLVIKGNKNITSLRIPILPMLFLTLLLLLLIFAPALTLAGCAMKQEKRITKSESEYKEDIADIENKDIENKDIDDKSIENIEDADAGLRKTMKDAEASIRIGLTGDVMLGRLVNEKIGINYTYPWGDVISLLKETDLNIINLETTLTTSTDVVSKTFNFKADPEKVKCLAAARIDAVTIANNHILDFGEKGLQETINVLDKAGIKHTGAGINAEDAARPVILKKKNLSIGIIGYTDNEPEWKAWPGRPGTNYVRIGSKEDLARIEKDIALLREQVDIIIFTIHWGPNMRQRPSTEFQEFAHSIIDMGTDVFYGHSAHIFQGIEVYNGKPVLYDTGDFVDDYYVTPELRNDQSFFYILEINKPNLLSNLSNKAGVKNIELVPVLISNMQVNKATGNDYREAVNRMTWLSEEFGTKIETKKPGSQLYIPINNNR